MKIREKLKANLQVVLLSFQLWCVRLELRKLLVLEKKRKIGEMKQLREDIEEDPYDSEKWIQLFDDNEKVMSKKKRKQYVRELQETFDDTAMRRLVFQNSIDGIYSDEEAMLDNIPQTAKGLQTLCIYIRRHMNSEYAINLLFDDFDEIMDKETKNTMKELLLSHFTLDHLKCLYPYEFGFPDIENEGMYDWDSLEPQLSPELRDYFMDGMK